MSVMTPLPTQTTPTTTATAAPATSSGGIKGALASVSKPAGGLLAFGLGICGFAVPALHGLGVPLSTALIVAGLGAYNISVSKA